MTREEQLKEYLKERNIPIDSLEANSIREGAKWADENPKEGLVSLDKACKWLGNRDVMEKILHCRTSLIDDYVKAFRKAMEE